MTYRQLYDWGRHSLREAGVEEADLDARLLLEFVCGTRREDLFAGDDIAVTDRQREYYGELVKKRGGRIPLQYLTGVQNFMGLDFSVGEATLIPRQDTEILTEEVMRNLHDGMDILDLCTGTGCILISLLKYSNGCRGVGTDISRDALALAASNAKKLIPECVERDGVRFLESDLFSNVEGMFDIVVSNPPYIPTKTIETLMPEVRCHEPAAALDGGEDGLLFYRRILAGIGKHLKRGGMLFFETGFDQGRPVGEMMQKAGFCEVTVKKDYAGLDRVVSGVLGF